MAAFSPSGLLRAFEALPPTTSGGVCVAFSGGLDSTVLLTALLRAPTDRARFPVRAVHVDHQLRPESAEWAEHCRLAAQALGVELVVRRVDIAHDDPSGPEAAARAARYGALRDVLQPQECLLTAHHADDQLETLLLALMRGAGVRGLAGMEPCRRFGLGWHVRPLLSFARADLERWARDEGLTWIADPSNDETRFDRNYLRNVVLPMLATRWPAAAITAARSATHLQEASAVLDAVAAADLQTVALGPCLRLSMVLELEAMRRRNLLRYWFRRCGATAPSTRKLAAIEHDMSAARADRTPCIEWGGFEVRRHRGLLYCLPAQPPLQADPAGIVWDGREPLPLPAHLGKLRTEEASGAGLAAAKLVSGMRIRFRTGRDRIQPVGDGHHRKLKKLLQAANILPWWRNRVPLVDVGGKLAAVGDLWVADEFAARVGERGVRIVWEARPRIEAHDASEQLDTD